MGGSFIFVKEPPDHLFSDLGSSDRGASNEGGVFWKSFSARKHFLLQHREPVNGGRTGGIGSGSFVFLVCFTIGFFRIDMTMHLRSGDLYLWND